VAKKPGQFFYRAKFRENASGLQLPGRDGRALGYVPAYHRVATNYSPFCIPNELICYTLGRFLGLPIPPCSITFFNDQPYFSCLDFNPNENEDEDEDETPAINPDVCAVKFPWECTGILFFDILVANPDRHEGNLAVDDIDNPKELIVYDHDQALFGGGNDPIGVPRLRTLWDRPGITGGEATGGSECCLLRSLSTIEYFNEWRNRIEDIPNWFIKDTCNSVIGIGAEKNEAKEVTAFLVHRKNTIRNLVQLCKYAAPLIATWRPDRVLFRP